jgi:hypothetical protein
MLGKLFEKIRENCKRQIAYADENGQKTHQQMKIGKMIG